MFPPYLFTLFFSYSAWDFFFFLHCTVCSIKANEACLESLPRCLAISSSRMAKAEVKLTATDDMCKNFYTLNLIVPATHIIIL